MADFILFPLRVIGSVIGLFGRFGIGGAVRRIRDGSVKFNHQGVAFCRPDLNAKRAD